MLRTIAVLLAMTGAAAAQTPDFTREQAASAELTAMCAADAGRLWGTSLCGPFIAVDPRTRAAWANQADLGGVLVPGAGGWIGVLPDDAPIANTAVEWSGVRWTMVVTLPEDETDRRVLLAHEAWHRIQLALGFIPAHAPNAHLEEERGRYLLRLELRALRAAMHARGSARWQRVREALDLRAARLASFLDAAREETALDRNEGIASYNGVKLGAAANPHAYAARTLERHDANTAFARSYAYASGPAYGLLLDERRRDWRTTIGDLAPADLLAQTLRFRPSAAGLARAEARHDPGGEVAAAEAARGAERRAQIAELLRRYGPGERRVVLPIEGQQISFDPRRVTPIGELGAVYGIFSMRGAWGEMRAEDGALVAHDFSQVTVADPGEDGLSGPGWTITPAPGYRLIGPDADGVLRLIEGAADAPPT